MRRRIGSKKKIEKTDFFGINHCRLQCHVHHPSLAIEIYRRTELPPPTPPPPVAGSRNR